MAWPQLESSDWATTWYRSVPCVRSNRTISASSAAHRTALFFSLVPLIRVATTVCAAIAQLAMHYKSLYLLTQHLHCWCVREQWMLAVASVRRDRIVYAVWRQYFYVDISVVDAAASSAEQRKVERTVCEQKADGAR